MRKLFISAAAAAAMLGGAMFNAQAAPEVDPDCGTASTGNGYWVKTLISSGGETFLGSTTEYGDLNFSGKSGNAVADATQVDTYQTTSAVYLCLDYNNGGQLKGSFEVGGDVTGIRTEETALGEQKVCQNGGKQTSTSLVDGLDCSNPLW